MKSIGILGGGQLARLLSRSSQQLAFKTSVLSLSPEDPAAQNNPYWVQGDPFKTKDIKNFCKDIDILTFESEFFPADKIQKFIKNKQTIVCPSLKNMKHIQNRWLQKKLLKKHGLPTLDFFKIEFKKGQRATLLKLFKTKGAFVLKTCEGGYDGYGTFVVKSEKDTLSLKLPKTTFIMEKLFPFERELALLSARNKRGQVIFFPLVESFQKNSICYWVKGPARHKKLTELKKKIRRFLSDIDYQGLMAFELFDKKGDLIINELAPRVHNTGHYSLSALTEDQFAVHLKAISNQSLKAPRLKAKAFAMLNLLGEACKKPLYKDRILTKQEGLFKKQGLSLYWYGKKESRRGRKMGHLNCLSSSSEEALDKLLAIKKHIKV